MGQLIGKFLIIAGILAIASGTLFFYSDRFSFLKNFGKLPGDIHVKKGNFSFYFPVTTSIILSIIISLIMRAMSRQK
jgi:hypothetical protein